MSFLDEVYAKRQKLAAVLVDEDYSGIRDLVAELYPDRAHFLFELLQNAEDAGATEVAFYLRPDKLIFEHDGRPFDHQDVLGITNIGKGSKKDQEDKIGRFGVGFKAVFAYCETPHIWSPTFCFKITDLVSPSEIPPKDDLTKRTRFEFPFNNPKKSPADSFQEVEVGLRNLAETTLLFLSGLKTIYWQVGDAATGKVYLTRHSENHVEVVRESDGKVAGCSHFLKFDGPVEGLENQRVAVAFALDFLPNVEAFDPAMQLANQLKIIPATPGRVAVFFPAEKEESGLRFHLHAPFVPELSRASIKESTANQPLFQELAILTAASLHEVRDLGLLTPDFLAVLPNPQDSLPGRYAGIRNAIVEALNERPLTPTHGRSHAPAKYLLRAKASLKDLLTDNDLEFLMQHEGAPLQWAIGAAQRNSNADRFLCGLAVTEWDIKDFVKLLSEKTFPESSSYDHGPDAKFMDWLSEKPLEWHQRLYSLLYTELNPSGRCRGLKGLSIVRLSSGEYNSGSDCFFPSAGVEHDDVLPRVDAGVYTAGKSRPQQLNARRFLEEIGVREVGEAEQVEAILKQRYTRDNLKPQRQDLKRFIALVETEPKKAVLFKDYFIFEGGDGEWHQPSSIFVDLPFADTGLSAYYDTIGGEAKRYALSKSYHDCEISAERMAKFAESVGAQVRLDITSAPCGDNPQWSNLYSVSRDRSAARTERDYTVTGLEKLLANPTLPVSKLIWRTMMSLPTYPDYLQATYRKNQRSEARCAASQLVHHLRNAAWIPQRSGAFVRPAGASRELLPEGFPLDPGWKWLNAIQFGQEEAERPEDELQRRALARRLGFGDDDTLDRARRFAEFPAEEQRRILAEQEARVELPDQSPVNLTQRALGVAEQAQDAAGRTTEERPRSISVNRDAVKEKAGVYLRHQYTNREGQMICQVCKKRLPFQRLDDGTDYFERVEFLPALKGHHEQNYLALCPNHAAMFQYANGSRKVLRDGIMDMHLVGNTLPVVLAKEEMMIYFTTTHLADLKVVIGTDQGDAEETGEEDTDEIGSADSPEPGDLSGRTQIVAQS